MQKITPCLWFDSNAEEAVKFYTSIFKKSKIGKISRYGKEGYEIHGKPEGTVLTVEFELNGQTFTALNGGPTFKFNEAISFQVHCKSQNEVDYYREELSKGGDDKAQQCGWLEDRYGVSWQIVPDVLMKMLRDKNTEKSERVISNDKVANAWGPCTGIVWTKSFTLKFQRKGPDLTSWSTLRVGKEKTPCNTC